MKKWLISLVLFFAPLYVNAASLTISNPVISQGLAVVVPGQNSQYVFAFEQIKSGSVNLTLDAALSGAVDKILDMNVTSYLHNWSLSILEQSSGLSTNLVVNSILDTQNISFAFLAGTVYQFVFTGTSPLRHFSIEISEVPLPAAFWLFGSVIMGGIAIKRRKSAQLKLAV